MDRGRQRSVANSHATTNTKSFRLERLRNGKRASIEPPCSGTGSGNMPAGRRKLTGGHSVHPPAVRSDFDGTPVLVGEIKIDASGMLGDADVDGALGSVKLRPRLEQIEFRGDRVPAQGASRGLIVAATQPTSKALAADWPGFPVTVDREIGKGGASGGAGAACDVRVGIASDDFRGRPLKARDSKA